MNMDNMIKKYEPTRRSNCYDDYKLATRIVCAERYDRILDVLEAQRAWIWNWLGTPSKTVMVKASRYLR